MSLGTTFKAAVYTALVGFALAATGCDKESNTKAPAPSPQAGQSGAPKAATRPLLQQTAMVDWCKEHGMAESICAQCNTSLAADFKAKGDWCNEHSVPESQCFACQPGLKEKFADDFKAKTGKEPPAMSEEEHDHEENDGKSGK